MNLAETLTAIETQIGLEPGTLQPYADTDDIGGFHPDPEQRQWDVGAIWDVEGRILYALIRALKPYTVLEIGSGTGCSTTHAAAALYDNGGGSLTTIDRGNAPVVPENLLDIVDIRGGDALDYLNEQPDHSIDFLIEDADHSRELCMAIGQLAHRKLSSGGLLIAHDAAHIDVGPDVKTGFATAGLDFRVYLTEPSDCGWLIWKAPVFAPAYGLSFVAGMSFADWPEKPKRTIVAEDGEELEIVDAPPVEKPKRKRTTKAKK